MLAQRLQRWPNIKTALGQRPVLSDYPQKNSCTHAEQRVIYAH